MSARYQRTYLHTSGDTYLQCSLSQVYILSWSCLLFLSYQTALLQFFVGHLSLTGSNLVQHVARGKWQKEAARRETETGDFYFCSIGDLNYLDIFMQFMVPRCWIFWRLLHHQLQISTFTLWIDKIFAQAAHEANTFGYPLSLSWNLWFWVRQEWVLKTRILVNIIDFRFRCLEVSV